MVTASKAPHHAEIRRQLARFNALKAAADAKDRERIAALVAAELAKFKRIEARFGPVKARAAPPARVSAKSLGTACRAPAHEHKTLAFAVKATTPGAAPSFSGYAGIFNNVDGVGDIIVPGAFAQDLPEFLADGFIGGLGHNWDQPVARIKSAREDGKGLLIESGPIVDTTHGVDVAKLLRAGIVRKLSIGYRAIEPRMVDDLAEVEAFWKSVNYYPTSTDRQRAREGVRLLTRVKLLEVSPVAVPANSLADITGVKSRPRPTLAMSR